MPLRQSQIICGALAAGLLAMAVVLGGFAHAGIVTTVPGLLPPLAGAVALALPTAVLLGVAIRSSMLQQARLAWLRERDANAGESIVRFEAVYARASIVQSALLEGFGLLGGVGALVTGQLLFLAAPAIAIVGIGLVFPTEMKFRALADRLTQPPDEREFRVLEALQARDDNAHRDQA